MVLKGKSRWGTRKRSIACAFYLLLNIELLKAQISPPTFEFTPNLTDAPIQIYNYDPQMKQIPGISDAFTNVDAGGNFTCHFLQVDAPVVAIRSVPATR